MPPLGRRKRGSWGRRGHNLVLGDLQVLGDGGVREVVEPQAGAGQGVRQGAQGLD